MCIFSSFCFMLVCCYALWCKPWPICVKSLCIFIVPFLYQFSSKNIDHKNRFVKLSIIKSALKKLYCFLSFFFRFLWDFRLSLELIFESLGVCHMNDLEFFVGKLWPWCYCFMILNFAFVQLLMKFCLDAFWLGIVGVLRLRLSLGGFTFTMSLKYSTLVSYRFAIWINFIEMSSVMMAFIFGRVRDPLIVTQAELREPPKNLNNYSSHFDPSL